MDSASELARVAAGGGTPSDARARAARVVDLVLGSPLAELAPPARVVAAARALAEAPLAALLARLVGPARGRVLDAFAGSERPLAAWLDPASRDELAALAGEPWRLPRDLVEPVVTSPRVRAETRLLLEQSLKELVNEVFAAAPGGKGVLGLVSLGARAAAGAASAFLGDRRVSDVVNAAVARLERRVVDKLTSETAAVRFAEWRRQAFLALLERGEGEAARFLGRLPWPRLEARLAPLISWNLRRDELTVLAEAELAAAWAALGERTLGEILEELGLKAALRELAVDVGERLVLRGYTG